MATRFGLRLRVFLFFSFMAAGALALCGGALFLGWSRATPDTPAAPFLTAFITFAMLNTGLLLGIWLLFDENVAKPILKLSADLRMRAHADVTTTVETSAARYLGDLAPAAAALTEKAEQGVMQSAAHIARETRRLGEEKSHLTALLSNAPVATILVNAAHEIVLYDTQAADVLSTIAQPRLRAPLSDYFSEESLEAAFNTSGRSDTHCALAPVGGGAVLDARIRALDTDGHMLFFDPAAQPETAVSQRPLVFDFNLLAGTPDLDLAEQPLSSLSFVVFDLETTGLSVETDEVVQIGAVRVVNGAIVQGEEYDTFVNPGCPIPAVSTRVHGVSDADVANAAPFANCGKQLHHFARGAVLVAHNAPFDMGFLQKSATDMGVTWDHPVLDTVLLSAVAFGTTQEHSLDALCARLGITIPEEDRHNALGDARVTAAALVALLKMLQGRGYTTLADLRPAMAQEAKRLYASTSL